MDRAPIHTEIAAAGDRLGRIAKRFAKLPVGSDSHVSDLIAKLHAGFEALDVARKDLHDQARRLEASKTYIRGAVRQSRELVRSFRGEPLAKPLAATASLMPSEFSRIVVEVEDRERRRIARELHDSTGQTLTALAARLALLKGSASKLDRLARGALKDSLELTRICAREVRTLAYLLHPPLLDEGGLRLAIRHFVREFSLRSQLHVNLALPVAMGRLPRDVELALFRVIQECLMNAHVHSGSATVTIRLKKTSRGLTLEVRDRGRGMPRAASLRRARRVSGVGIAGMHERIRHVGGDMTIDSTPHGVKVRAQVPLGNSRAR